MYVFCQEHKTSTLAPPEEVLPGLTNRDIKESYGEEETIPELPNRNTKESYGKEETIPELPNRNSKESYGKEEIIPDLDDLIRTEQELSNKISQGNTTDGLKYETAGGIEEDKSVEIGAGESKTKYENEFIPEIDNIHEPEQESPENTTQLLTTQLTPGETTEGSVQVRAGEADGKYGSISITEEQQSLENTTQHLTVQLAQTEHLDESGLMEEVIGNDTYNKIEDTNNTEENIIKVTSTSNLHWSLNFPYRLCGRRRRDVWI